MGMPRGGYGGGFGGPGGRNAGPPGSNFHSQTGEWAMVLYPRKILLAGF